MTDLPYDRCAAVDARIDTILAVEAVPEARKPVRQRTIDLGTKRSSARIADFDTAEGLVDCQGAVATNGSRLF